MFVESYVHLRAVQPLNFTFFFVSFRWTLALSQCSKFAYSIGRRRSICVCMIWPGREHHNIWIYVMDVFNDQNCLKTQTTTVWWFQMRIFNTSEYYCDFIIGLLPRTYLYRFSDWKNETIKNNKTLVKITTFFVFFSFKLKFERFDDRCLELAFAFAFKQINAVRSFVNRLNKRWINA